MARQRLANLTEKASAPWCGGLRFRSTRRIGFAGRHLAARRILVKAPERNVTLSWLNAKHAGVGPLRRPEPFGDLEPHLSTAEGLITQMRIRNPRIGMARDGHEPNEAEEQRPRRVPVKPVHVNSSPKTPVES